MSGVKRYDISGFGGGMVESKEGAFYHMDDYDTLRTANQRLEGEVARMRAFANAMVTIALEGSDADGAHIQEVAEELGLIEQKTMTEPCCGPDDGYCSCAYNSGFPTTCYQRTAALASKGGE